MGFAMALSESAFQAQVQEYAELKGWAYLHIDPSTNSRGYWRTPVRGALGAGWPDLFLVRGERVLVAELKADRGTVTPLQKNVLGLLAGAGLEVYVWRPRDWYEVMMRLD